MNKIRSKYYLLLVLVAGYVFPFTNIETGWEYTQATEQCFYMFEYINIDNIEATGDGQPGNIYAECSNNPYSCDVVGAFIERDENILGDLNDDSEINIYDIITLVTIIMLEIEVSDLYLWLGDLNYDLILDILDLTSIINIILE